MMAQDMTDECAMLVLPVHLPVTLWLALCVRLSDPVGCRKGRPLAQCTREQEP